LSTKKILAAIRAGHEKTIAKMDAWLAEMKDGRREMKAGQETTEVYLECKAPT
jgi:hypothetical protein